MMPEDGPPATASKPTRRKFAYAAVVPLAGLFTIGLTLTMAALIATEFQPQDEAENFAFQINPVEMIIEPPLTITPPDALQRVDVPPPPPKLSDATVKLVTVAPRELPGAMKPFVPTTIDFGDGPNEFLTTDRDAKPFLRIPPVMPPRFAQGDHSGLCKVRFDVSPEGQPFNVEAYACTSRLLERATVKSVQAWKYTPKIFRGRAVARTGVESTIRFDLADARGRALPLP